MKMVLFVSEEFDELARDFLVQKHEGPKTRSLILNHRKWFYFSVCCVLFHWLADWLGKKLYYIV